MLEKLIAQIMAGYEISKAEAKMLIDYDLGTLKQGAELIRRSYCGLSLIHISEPTRRS